LVVFSWPGPLVGQSSSPQKKSSSNQKKAPPPVPREKLEALTRDLDQALGALPESVSTDRKTDLLGYRRAVRMAFDLGEDKIPGGSNRMEKVLESALAKARRPSTPTEKAPAGWQCRFYRSQIDGSLQPYAILLPIGQPAGSKKVPLELILHGRSDGLTECLFLQQHETAKPQPSPHILVEVFGRGNNAYRWAGETDCFEALEDVLRRDGDRVDRARIILRGFSMGGAGTWHIGVHHSDRFCAIQPGAGFTKTIGYAKTVPADMPAWKKSLLTRYDAIACATNLAMVPVVAYSGAEDPQKDAALSMERALEGEPEIQSRFKHLVALGLAHKMPPEWKAKVDQELAGSVSKGVDPFPTKIDWTATSVRYGACHWVRITGLERQGQPGRVQARRGEDRWEIQTRGITHLDLRLDQGQPSRVVLDGQERTLTERGWVSLKKVESNWEKDGVPLESRKRPGLQGPIDDAFMEGFVVTLGRGQPWNRAAQEKAEAELSRFRKEWVEFMRGDFPFVEEKDITPQLLRSKHLVVFGDPGSSSVLKQALGALPYRWDSTNIAWKGKNLESTAHLPFSIQPNPLSPTKYLVINTGHTFHEPQFKGTNALLFSQHGDHGLFHIPSGLVVQDGVFDEQWRFGSTLPAP